MRLNNSLINLTVILNRNDQVNNFIAEQAAQVGLPEEAQHFTTWEPPSHTPRRQEPCPHCSRMEEPPLVLNDQQPQLSRAEVMLRDAEQAKARIYDVKGKDGRSASNLDEDYLIVGSHIDDAMVKKIAGGDYIDFAKLIAKDKIQVEEDHRMELINQNSVSYWVPVSDREITAISGFGCWEQAFRIYSNVYT